MSSLPDELPYGWPGPAGNAAAERLAALPTSNPSYFSRKRAVAKEIVQAIKAVVGGVEGVHEALLNALERGEVRKMCFGGAEKRERKETTTTTTDDGNDSKARSFPFFSSFCFSLLSAPCSLSLSPKGRESVCRGRRGGRNRGLEKGKEQKEGVAAAAFFFLFVDQGVERATTRKARNDFFSPFA